MKFNNLLKSATLLIFGLLSGSLAQAQHYPYQTWGGGDGTWDAGVALGWSGVGGQTGSGLAWVEPYPATIDNVTTAYFSNTPGTLTVDDSSAGAPVIVGELDFNAPSSAAGYVITGDPLYQMAPAGSATAVYVANNGATYNVNIQSDLNIALNPGNESTYFFNDNPGTVLTLGNINFLPDATIARNDQNVNAISADGTTTIFNGAITSDPSLQQSMRFGDYGTNSSAIYEINGALNFVPRGGPDGKEFDFAAGNILVGTDQLGTGSICYVGNGNGDNGTSPAMEFLTSVSGLTITNRIYAQNQSNAEIGGATAGATTYTGEISAGQGGGRLRLNAATGGTVTFDGVIDGNDSYVLSSGSGTIVLNEAAGNTYSIYTPNAFEVSTGTTVLIQNATGSAFGSTTNAVALVDGGATLGGYGISFQQVVAAAHTSTLAPGNGTAINTLHLNGGLSTTGTSGLTMKFDLNGALNDSIDFAAAAVVLDGAIDVSFANLGSVLTDHVYTLLTGTGDWTGGTPTFAITAPTGYVLNAAYGTGGYEYTTTGGADSFSVEFSAAPVPEPSPILLVAVSIAGLAFLCWAHRLHTLNA